MTIAECMRFLTNIKKACMKILEPSASQTQPTIAHITQTLGETAKLPQGQVGRIVRCCGSEQALAWLAEAQKVAASGGLATADGTRPRTLGGIFFKIVRDALRANGQDDHFNQIFRYRHQRAAKSHAVSTKATPALVVPWSERGAQIIAAAALPGKVNKVKVTLIGRPGKIIAKPDFTLLQMKHSGGLPAVPKGIPLPAQVPETTYIVYIGAKQWRGVAEAIKQPDDVLIVEGSQFYDKEFEAIAVFATNTTTRTLQQAKRQAQAER